MKKVGILGGSFNPPHYGHLRTASLAQQEGCLDEVLFIPAGRHVFGKSLAFDIHRINMLCYLLKQYVSFEIRDYELTTNDVSLTLNTVKYLKQKSPGTEFSVIMGADVWHDIDKWYKVEEIFKIASPLVVKRPGYPPPEPSGSVNLLYVNEESLNISSSDIRNRISDGKSCVGLMPIEVIKYIGRYKLYT